MKNLLSNPWTRLAARALLVAIVSAIVQINQSDGTIVWRSVVIAGVLAFCEVFTPLNALVGVFKRTTVKPT